MSMSEGQRCQPHSGERSGGFLRLAGLSKSFGPRPVLRQVDLTASSGQVVLVAGANGSGKSTLLKIVAGLLRPSSGRVESSIPRQQVGYLGHETLMYPQLSVRENLSFWMRLYRVPVAPDEVDGLLQRFGLKTVQHEPAGILSRGMAQKLSLARLLSISPRLLLMDEPSTGLDPQAQQLLRWEIQQAGERGCIVLWVSHAPDQDGAQADTVLTLKGGRAGFRTTRAGQ
jgi:heme exporter protein A